MAKSDKGEGDMRVTSIDGAGRMRRFITTTLILVVIAWGFVFFALRTAGGQDFAYEWLSRQAGLELTGKQVQFGFPFVVTFTSVTSVGYSDTGAGVTADEVRVALGVRPWSRVRIHQPVINLVYGQGEGWAPDAFARLGALPGKSIADLSRLCQRWRHRLALEIHDGSINWLDDKGKALAAARGVEFSQATARVPQHQMDYFHLSLYSVQDAAGDRLSDVSLEWLASETRPLIELSRSDNLATRRVDGFWRGE
ncbi:MAG: hypothetical protein O3A51_07860 [Verrucomicrobia bacterium]|nr:hypothetical protein [Verrucomicrobiota bacterium]